MTTSGNRAAASTKSLRQGQAPQEEGPRAGRRKGTWAGHGQGKGLGFNGVQRRSHRSALIRGDPDLGCTLRIFLQLEDRLWRGEQGAGSRGRGTEVQLSMAEARARVLRVEGATGGEAQAPFQGWRSHRHTTGRTVCSLQHR